MPKPFSRLTSPDPTTNRIIQDIYDKLNQLSGEVSTLSSDATATSASSGVIPGIYGSAALIPQITLDSQGRATKAINVGISGPFTNTVIKDTHANRVRYPAKQYKGTLYYETDRTVYYLSDGVTWLYTVGDMKCTQAALPTDLGASDHYFIVDVTDYGHRLLWGSAGAYSSGWVWAPGEEGSGEIRGFLVDPTGSGWHLCDGSVGVVYLKSDGTTSTKTLPDLVSAANKAAYLKFGSPSSSIVNTAVAPTLAMNSYTPAGTITSPLVMNSYTPGGTNSIPVFTGSALGTHQHQLPIGQRGTNIAISTAATGGTFTSNLESASIAAGNSFTGLLDQAVSAGTPSGTVSAPTFAGTPATLTGTVTSTFSGTPATLTGTITATGEPQNVVLRPWFRQ